MKEHQFPSNWQAGLDALCARVYEIRAAIGDAWPYHCDPKDGVWDTTEDGDWCGGHWVECLRIVGELTGDRKLEREAAQRAERLRPYLERDDMFRGHRFYYGAVRQFAWTGDTRFRTLGLAAAYAVRSMAMKGSGAMPIGTQVQVRSTKIFGRDKACVDNVHPNLILDWWAFGQTGDPEFIAGARRHLDHTIEQYICDDYSTIEFRDYDPETGQPVGSHFTLLGANDDSCWSRGQAWAIAGYLRAWEATRDPRYLSVGKKLLDYWIANTEGSLIPPYDFKDPLLKSDRAAVPLDTSAAAVVVEQLARITLLKDLPPEAEAVASNTVPFIEGLLKHLTSKEDGQARSAGVLLHGCFNRPKNYATASELIWGTAYFLFALYYLKTGRIVE
jgi:unsaturated chondroitin disaccharide hydrolase